MRRPGKELVDAVPGAEERERGGGRAGSETVVIKKEEEEEWARVRGEKRVEPGSPLEGKVSTSVGQMGILPASVLTERRRRASGLLRDEGEHVDSAKGSGAANAVAALVAGTARVQHHTTARNRERGGQDYDRDKDRFVGGDVYDFHGSGSEPETERRGKDKGAAPAAMKVNAKARDGEGGKGGSGHLPHREKIRVSRRVSSVVEGLGQINVEAGKAGAVGRAGGGSGMGETLNSTTGSLRSRGKRRDTLATGTGDSDVEGKENEEGGGKGLSAGRREERAVGRRRSMMI